MQGLVLQLAGLHSSWRSRAARRYGVMMSALDTNWAMSMQAFHHGKPGLGILPGGGLALWLF